MADAGTAAGDTTIGDGGPGGAPLGGSGGDATGAGGTGGSMKTQRPTPPPDLTGTWYLNRDGKRVTLNFAPGSRAGIFAGTTAPEDSQSPPDAADQFSFDDAAAQLSFCAHEPTGDVWYALRFEDGVVAGRFAAVATGLPRPTDPLAYQGRVTGWHHETFSRHMVPRSWDITIDGRTSAVLRLDRSAPNAADFVGRLKLYATDGQLDEHLEEDVQIESWDGVSLSFVRRASSAQERFTGTASGRMIAGSLSPTVGSATADAAHPWTGHRIEVLSHGVGAKTAVTVFDWQARTRARLGLLTMGGNRAPLSFSVSELRTIDSPFADNSNWRDDDATSFPQQYRLTELAFNSTLQNPWGGPPMTRQAHGYVSVPTTPPPEGGFPVLLALNGHYGSALDVFAPAWWFWYGDSFARRGYVVIAVDIGHRPTEDRGGLYIALEEGDDPVSGNGPHPSVKSPGMTTDWEEDGERTWDAMRALDYALGRPDVNPNRVVLAGLSMGGEISDWTAAMDVRVGTTFAAGSTPDLSVMSLHDNHPCWKWQRGDAREYFDPGDLEAMAAPRLLVRETGAFDYTYSSIATPYSAAKEVIRRAKPAFDALGGQLFHYLHADAHAFHAGDLSPATGMDVGVTVPLESAPDPDSLWSTVWDGDSRITRMANSIFALMPTP